MTEQPETRRRSLWRRSFAVILMSLVLVAVVVLARFQQFLATPISLPADGLVYTLPSGTSLGRLARDLQQQGLIEQPRFFILLGRKLGVAARLQAGEYELEPGLTPEQLLARFVDGKVIQHELTLIEGQTFREMMERVHAHPVLEHTLTGSSDAEIMAAIGYPDVHPEGRFLPDTYHLTRGTTDVAFLQRAYAAMQETLQTEWADRAEGLPLESAEEALILASIVEKETGLPEERPTIAGVFTRRLQKNMKLQTDPTVIYGMGEAYDGNIRKRDLLTDTPYNTYTRRGLTPTPIAMPGADAIRAVLHPADGKSLYFVATGDGGHYFSSNLKQHERAVDKYQRKRAGIELPPSTH